MRFVGTWKTSEAENEKRRQMAAAAQKAAAQKQKQVQVAEAAELARRNAANARQDMQSQVSATLNISTKTKKIYIVSTCLYIVQGSPSGHKH